MKKHQMADRERRSWPAHVKKKVVTEYVAGLRSIEEIAEEYGVPTYQIERWHKSLQNKGLLQPVQIQQPVLSPIAPMKTHAAGRADPKDQLIHDQRIEIEYLKLEIRRLNQKLQTNLGYKDEMGIVSDELTR